MMHSSISPPPPLPVAPNVVRPKLSTGLPSVGEQFDKYCLLAKLATGGMAELFVAQLSGAAGFSKKVVIKRVLPHVAHDEHFSRMFLDEARICAQINHPNVCQVFELCESHGTHFLVLEHLEGATVGELIRRSLASEQQLNLPLAVGIIVQACDGLQAAHEQVDGDGHSSNLVHRDVSPGNLFVTVDGIVKVLDFGIAKARWMSRKTKTGTLLGKCEYMSPEQARGGTDLDRRSDIFSLGIIAWELFCGQRLFRRESEYSTLRAVLRAPIASPQSIRPTIPEALDHAIMRALERDPADRFDTAYEFRQAMADALREVGGPTPMCDIAPFIRSSFAQELKIQRAILRQATKYLEASDGIMPRLASAPPTSGDQNFASTDVLTREHQRLPSIAGPDELESKELTFGAVPKGTPGTARLAKVPRHALGTPGPPRNLVLNEFNTQNPKRLASQTLDSTPPAEAIRCFSDKKHQPPSALPESNSTAIAASAKTARMRNHSSTGVWVGLILLLGAGVTMASLFYFRQGHTSEQEASVQPSTVLPTSDPPKVDPQAEHPTPPTATQNANAQAQLLKENQRGDHAVIHDLSGQKNVDKATMGTVEIRSSRPGEVYLYPSKRILGTTPLHYQLAPGRYKLKLQVGAKKGQKKYFRIKVDANTTTTRSFDHWKSP